MRTTKAVSYIIDSAIGPVTVTSREVESFSMDDFVHLQTISAARNRQFERRIDTADRKLAANRLPVEFNGKRIGGYK